jgi:hypothetical protein
MRQTYKALLLKCKVDISFNGHVSGGCCDTHAMHQASPATLVGSLLRNAPWILTVGCSHLCHMAITPGFPCTCPWLTDHCCCFAHRCMPTSASTQLPTTR